MSRNSTGRLHEKIAPYSPQMRLLMQIPGVNWVIADNIIAEIGVDMSAFVNAAHLAAWGTMCPGKPRKRRKAAPRQDPQGQCPPQDRAGRGRNAAGKTKGTYLAGKYRRLKSRRGALRAAVACGGAGFLDSGIS